MKRTRKSAAAPAFGRYLQRYKPPLVGSTPGTGSMRPSIDMAASLLQVVLFYCGNCRGMSVDGS